MVAGQAGALAAQCDAGGRLAELSVPEALQSSSLARMSPTSLCARSAIGENFDIHGEPFPDPRPCGGGPSMSMHGIDHPVDPHRDSYCRPRNAT